MNKMFLFLLLSAFAIFAGCAKEEQAAAARSNDYVIVANQDERNRLKYSFKVMHNGAELTTKNAVFSWNFGDAAGSSTLSNPTYEYAEESERKVSVNLLVRDGDTGRVTGNASADISLLVGSSPDVYRAVIHAYPGEGNDLLKYRLVSSALPSDVNGGGTLLYYWRITGPDGENNQDISYRYPDNDSVHITSNTLDQHRFLKYGYGYDIDLYITNAGSSFDMNTASPSSTMRLTTALPDFTVQCGIKTENSITCTPKISTTNADFLSKVEYTWTFYSYNDAGVPVKDGTDTTNGSSSGGSVDYTFKGEGENGGLKMIEVTATHPTHMNGTVRATTDVALNTNGILGAVSCERPTNTWGEYTDSTKLKYRCSVEGYYNDSEHLGTPLALSQYKWIIKIGSEGGASFTGNGEYAISGTADDTPINDVLLKKIECGGELGNRCISTIEFDAKKYGETYYIGVSGQKESSSTVINGTATTITVDKPKLVSIDRTADETNARISTFKPVFDTTLPDTMELEYYWEIEGTNPENPSDKWDETGNSITYDNTTAIKANGKHVLNHTFSKNGNYNVALRIKSNMYANKNDGASSTTEIMEVVNNSNTLGPLEINQEITGSYFRVVPNYTTNEYRFYTDYDLRVNGVVQPAYYIYKIYGPSYNDPRNTPNNYGPEQKVILKNGKEYTTLKPVNPETTPANNAKLLFGAKYGVQLSICAEAFYDANARACNRQTAHGAQENVTYRDIYLNGASNYNAGSFTTGTLNWILQKPDGDAVQTTWYTKQYLDVTTTVNGKKVPIDRSIFKCTWDFSGATNQSVRVKVDPPFSPNKANERRVLNNVSCNDALWVFSYGEGFVDRQAQNATLKVYGPEYFLNAGKRLDYKNFNASFLFANTVANMPVYTRDDTPDNVTFNH